ncbi:MAG: thrombospondin type 3 repeat-containing protein [Sandaracinaceae bacterium]|nr:thrombospondin type 3 repeat-containing protein [Sandaracinaceae bacterium]
MLRWTLLLAVFSLAAPRAEAQTSSLFSYDDFSAHRFYVAPGPNNFFLVEGADPGPDMSGSFGATLGYMHEPFAADDLSWFTSCRQDAAPEVCRSLPSPTTETQLLGAALSLQLYGAFTFLERIQVGVNLPVLLYGEGEGFSFIERSMNLDGSTTLSTRTAAPGGTSGGLLDPRISAKIRILDPDRDGNGVTMAVSGWVQLPIGHYMWPGRFLGDPSPGGGVNAIGGFRFESFRLALNLGLAFREELTNIRSQIGTEVTFGLAAGYRFHTAAEVVLEYTGATSFGQRFDSEAPMGLRAGLLLHFGEVSLHVGASAGLVYGIGQEVFGVFAGMQFAPQRDPDTDRDGIPDSRDGCPDDPEDMDGFEDEDGCPELDNDGDGIPDATDACPDDPEDVDGHEDEDGCPDPDNDGDGIPDGYDSCPETPEDFDGDRDTDGCPDVDRDGDGIPDEEDQCPDEAEDFDGFADHDGCPEVDVDGDGIPDTEDECPEQPEDIDGFEDSDGCPEEGGGGRRRTVRGR